MRISKPRLGEERVALEATLSVFRFGDLAKLYQHPLHTLQWYTLYQASKPPIGMKTFRTAQPHVIDKGLATGCPASKTGREGDGAVVPCLSTSGNAAATTTWVSSR